MASSVFQVRVHYPLDAGELRLRTSLDWGRDVSPDVVDDGRQRFDFTLRSEGPYVYFKPVWHRGGAVHWSQGANYLAVAGRTKPRVLYPHFHWDPSCAVKSLRELDGYRYRVFLPPGYGENGLKRYPVLYMQDGQNLFFPEEAFAGQHWRVRRTLALLTQMNRIDKVIVVGVYPTDRMADYTQPGYARYGDFLVGRLKPQVDAQYRTLPGPEHTAVMGSSLGGVVSFYLAWQHPGVFGAAACLSSTFGYRDDLRDRVGQEAKPAIRLYLDSGWPRDNYEVTRDMAALLRARGFRAGDDLHYLTFPEAAHNERDWALRSHIPFQIFFGQGRIDP